MEQKKINIAELLKDCPKGMELYSTIYGTVYFEGVRNTGNAVLIDVKTSCNTEVQFYPDGKFNTYYSDSEMTLFPSKDVRNWEGFHRPFKDGDIVAYDNPYYRGHSEIFIFKDNKENNTLSTCYLMLDGDELYIEEDAWYVTRFATEEEKAKLFQAIKDNGYRWNGDTKTLEKLTAPSTPEKFYIRIGDIPSEEKSSVWKGDVVVGYEDGVSVYDCVETDGLYRIVMPFPLKEEQGMTYECLIQEITQCRYKIEKPRKVYLVSGIEVGKGHDNEPLIKDVKILKDLTEQFNTKNDNTEENKTLKKLQKFKDGDVLFVQSAYSWILIYKESENDEDIYKYIAIPDHTYHTYMVYDSNPLCYKGDISKIRLATEEEKQKLFQAIKDNGYHWNPETKTLEKLVKPKFKVGDRIVKQNSISNLWIVSSISSQYYGLNLLKGGESIGVLPISEQDDWELAPNIEPKFKIGDRIKDKNNRIWFVVHVSEKHFDISRVPNAEGEGSGYFVPIEDQDEYELVPNKFDITTLKPFDKVLYRMHRNDTWLAGFYNVCIKNRIFVIGLGAIPCCIPYRGNEHLLGTTNDCDEYYKTW